MSLDWRRVKQEMPEPYTRVVVMVRGVPICGHWQAKEGPEDRLTQEAWVLDDATIVPGREDFDNSLGGDDEGVAPTHWAPIDLPTRKRAS